jgi:putative endonuclease
MPESYYVYLLTNRSRTLYIGVTNSLVCRVEQHQQRQIPGFTRRYNIGQLVYYEAFNEIHDAIAREKQLKGWTRKKKIALIESANPNWDDLAVTTDMTLQSTT